MQHLFSPEGEAALASLMRRRPLLAFDFDGTLAPIVERPDDARAAPEIADRLQWLAGRLPLAIVTGRAVADVQPRLGFTPQHLIGSHGAEDPAAAPAGLVADNCSAALDALRVRLAAERDAWNVRGVQIEDKGHSLALHYRRAADPGMAAAAIEVLMQELDPALATFGGKCVVNIVDAAAPDKGDAVAALLARCDADVAFFIGDDVNDETVFGRAATDWLTVRIGRDDPHSQAMFFLDGQDEVVALLDRMIALVA